VPNRCGNAQILRSNETLAPQYGSFVTSVCSAGQLLAPFCSQLARRRMAVRDASHQFQLRMPRIEIANFPTLCSDA
jgi:hypothetical protein